MKSKIKRPARRMVTEKMRQMLGLVKVEHGAHDNREEGMCVMEAVAYIAGEPHDDHPMCVSQAITEVMIQTNDSLDDESRQRLLEVVPEIIGTGWNGPGKTMAERAAECRQIEAMRLRAGQILEEADLDGGQIGAIEVEMLAYTLREDGYMSDSEIVDHVLDVVRCGAKERASLREIRADLASGRTLGIHGDLNAL